ncbi:MAG: ATP-binding cassette domain-containing protein [Candidatus Vecturithrix sp.]|jgi:ABC-type nitrate/sulfonate/bicarbonate transport system ATPase subunit|nr:ATP-binding cassette domain-containing protein [Candidatus Vecturithrix sp.]
MPTVLVVTELTKLFGTRPVIEQLSFSISKGERITLFAPSGAGKSTLINILSQIDTVFHGEFKVSAQNPATIFQEPRLFSYMTIQENIFFPLRVRQIPVTPLIKDQYEEWLEVCDLSSYSQHYPFQISGGMKQKVSLIRSFLMQPDFVMMDEPFKSIDIASKKRIIQHILQHYPDITLLLVTHNLDEIPLLTTSLLMFHTNFLAEFTEYSDISTNSLSKIFSHLFEDFT